MLDRVRALLVLAGALLLVLVAAPAAGAHIYWANKYDDAIGHAYLDGSGPNQSLVPGIRQNSHPVGVAVDGAHVYWTDYDAPDRIGRANLDGTGVNDAFITRAANPVALAVDGAHV